MHFLAAFKRAFVYGCRQTRQNAADRAFGKQIGKRILAAVGVAFQRMRQRIHAGFGRDMRRKRQADFSVQNSDIRANRLGFDGELLLFVRKGNDCDMGHFTGGSRGGRDRDKGGLCARLRQRQLEHILEIKRGIFVKQEHRLGGVDCRTAAHGNDQIGLKGTHLAEPGFHLCTGGIGADAAVDFDQSMGRQQGADAVDHAAAEHGFTAGDQQGAGEIQIF